VVQPKAPTKPVSLPSDDDEDDMMPHDFSQASKIIEAPVSGGHSRSHTPMQIKREAIVARSTPLSYMSRPHSA